MPAMATVGRRSPPSAVTSGPRLDRVLVASSVAVALFAVATRMHDVATWPAIRDWDASGHAVDVVDLLEGHLPDPRSWCGSHPPLYYAIGALLWQVLPESVPVHAMLRSVSVVAWIATVALVWRGLRRLGPGCDAAVVSALLLGVPGFAIAAGMMTNDALCTLLMTATLVRLLDVPGDTQPRHAAITGALAGLAAITKATGVAVVGMGALVYAWRSRREPSRGVRALVAFGLASAVMVAPHYVHLLSSVSGSPYDVLAARAGSREKEAIARVVEAVAPAGTSAWSYVSLQHSAMWGDPTAVLVRHDSRALWIGGWVVVGVAAVGAGRVVAGRDLARRAGVALVFGVLFAVALLPHVVSIPHIVLTKTNYLMPEALPLGILLVVGLSAFRGGFGTVLRAMLLALAVGGVAFTWYGGGGSGSVAVEPSTAPGSAAHVVARWFEERADDPIRAAERLSPDVYLASDLRLVRILGVPLADEPSSADDTRALELARGRVAWLELYNLIRWLQPTAAGLDVRVLDATERDDVAAVRVRVAARGTIAPPGTIGLWPFPEFEQRFTLRRAGDAWRITGVEQSGVVDENLVPAFVAWPTLGAIGRLRALGWRPDWAVPVAAGLARLAATPAP